MTTSNKHCKYFGLTDNQTCKTTMRYYFCRSIVLNSLSYSTHRGQGSGEAILSNMAGGSKNDAIC